MSTRDENMIAALRRERVKYLGEGKEDRVEQVDDQLRRLGYTPEADDDGPQGRTPKDPSQQSADQTTGQSAATDTGGATPPDGSAGTGDGAAAAPPAEEKVPAKKTAAARRSTAKE
ncbi:hypothetical protein ACIRFF_15735 [Streptomyces cyaneofuscatus]